MDRTGRAVGVGADSLRASPGRESISILPGESQPDDAVPTLRGGSSGPIILGWA